MTAHNDNTNSTPNTATIDEGARQQSPLTLAGLVGLGLLGLYMLVGSLFSSDNKETMATTSSAALRANHDLQLPYGSSTTVNELESTYDFTQLAGGPTSSPPALSLGRLDAPSVVVHHSNPTRSAHSADEQRPYGQNEDRAFMAMAANEPVITASATTHADLDYKILQGKVFTAVLTQAINSDLPGMVTAEMSQPVYGFSNRIELLPKGTKLVGTYDSAVMQGGKRVGILWQRAIRPDGIDIQIGSPGGDRLGQAGMTGFVDTYFWETFGTSALLSLMGFGASNLSDSEGDFSNQYQQVVVDAFVNSSNHQLRGRTQRKPTIHVDQGEIVVIHAARDLDFTQALMQRTGAVVF